MNCYGMDSRLRGNDEVELAQRHRDSQSSPSLPRRRESRPERWVYEMAFKTKC